jgi:hypothetical protein
VAPAAASSPGAVPAAASSLPAAPPGEAARAEARERFDRGLRLFNAGDSAGALVEFRRAYELVVNVVVLYNIGLVYAQMGRAVDATDALNQVLSSPVGLSPERRALAEKTRNDQAARIAEIAIQANVAGARIEVDGIDVGETPAAAPLRVTGGTHVVGLVAPGYSPQRKEIAIAGGGKVSLQFELVAMQGRLAHLAVKSHLPGADLFVDDQRVSTTPLSATVTLSPGPHHIELRRAGYATARTDVVLGDGASGEVTLEPEEDRAALAGASGMLSLDVSQSQPIVTIDGRARGLYTAAIRLVAGPHHLLIERGDFIPLERDVHVDAGRTTTVGVVLQPTPEFRAGYVARAESQKTWGWVSVGVGAALAAGGAALAAYDAKERSDGNATLSRINALAVPHSQLPCDPAGDTGTPAYQQTCAAPFASASSQVSDANTRDYAAWTGVGVGAAALALGVVLVVTAEDPHKFDEPASSPASGATRLRVSPMAWRLPGGGGIGMAGSF